MTTHKILLLALTLLACCAAPPNLPAREPPRYDRTNPPQGIFDDSWMAVMLAEDKLGYVHSQQERRGDEIHTSNSIRFSVRRAGAAVDVTMNSTSIETLDGKPLGFSSEMIASQVPLKQRGTIIDGVINLEAEQFGQKTQQKIPYPRGALLEWGMYLETLKHNAAPGTTIRLTAFVPLQALNVGIPTTIEVLGREEIKVFDRTVQALRTRTISEIGSGKLEAIGWADDDLNPIKQEVELLGQKFTMLRCDKAYALKDLDGVELFTSTLIPVGRRIDRDKTQAVTYVITSAADDGLLALPETTMQHVIDRKPGQLTLRVERRGTKPAASGAPVPPPAPEYLEASVFITSTDPLVIEMARSTVGSEKDPLRMAQALCRKVAAEIESKDLDTAFAPAAEVVRQKTGDCTEHGVLLAALGRAIGIPSRVVTGLIYVKELAGQQDVLGFHMWTQMWINDRWLDFDAAWDQIDPDPTHIALGTHSLKDGALGNLISGAMLQTSSLKIAVSDLQGTP